MQFALILAQRSDDEEVLAIVHSWNWERALPPKLGTRNEFNQLNHERQTLRSFSILQEKLVMLETFKVVWKGGTIIVMSVRGHRISYLSHERSLHKADGFENRI